jgi:hypothetical protein
MKSRKEFLNILYVFLLVTLGCDQISSTSIGKIIENPRKYAGNQVTINGEVTDSFSFFVVKYFVIRDGTGEVAVVTTRPLPKKGERIKVSGTVEEAFSIGDKQLLVLVEGEYKK